MNSFLEVMLTISIALNALALYFVYKVMPVIVKLTNRKTQEAVDSQTTLLSSVFGRLTDLEEQLALKKDA